MAKKVIVIGSGFGGLAVACRLAARGYQVEIFEKRDKLGGRAYVTEMGGFKFESQKAKVKLIDLLNGEIESNNN